MRFSEIEGYDDIIHKLTRTVLGQRVSHAQLFWGPEEAPKLALAIAYAQFINCTAKTVLSGEGDTALYDSCGVCPSCLKYQKLAHPDLHFIYPVATTKTVTRKPQSHHFTAQWRSFLTETAYRGNLLQWYDEMGIENKQGIINADDCNEIITTLSYKSYESEYKVMILWMVEKLYYAAAPKLLKILEEPPEKTLFILITDDPDQIIKTIVSRTLMVRISSVPGRIMPAAPDEEHHFKKFRQWMLACYAAKVPDLIGFSGEIAKSGREKAKSFLSYGLGILEACASFRHGLPVSRITDPAEREFIGKFSAFITAENLPVFNEYFNTAIYHIERNAHGPTLFLDLSLKIIRQFKPNSLPLPTQ
jgi:DNA polymerase-3 subunit delta'